MRLAEFLDCRPEPRQIAAERGEHRALYAQVEPAAVVAIGLGLLESLQLASAASRPSSPQSAANWSSSLFLELAVGGGEPPARVEPVGVDQFQQRVLRRRGNPGGPAPRIAGTGLGAGEK